MAMSLTEMKVGMSDKIAQQVVDTFVRHSEILELLPFDNCVSAGGIGSTLTYGYLRKKLPSTADFRALNNEFTASEATMEKATVDLKIFGGKYTMDRVLKNAEGQYNNEAYQLEEKIKAAVSLFNYNLIMGDEDPSTNPNGFDGLDQLLSSTSTEYGMASKIELETAAKVTSNAGAFYDALMMLIADTNADAILVNKLMKAKINAVARALGYRTESEEAFGRKITKIDSVRIIDLGNHYTVSGAAVTANACVPADITRTISSTSTKGLTDIYAVRFDANDGLCGVTLDGTSGLNVYRPDWKSAGAVKSGEVELVANIALKNATAAGVLRNIKIA